MKQLRHFGIKKDKRSRSHELYLEPAKPDEYGPHRGKTRAYPELEFYKTHPEIDPKETILISKNYPTKGFSPESPKSIAQLSQDIAKIEIAAEINKNIPPNTNHYRIPHNAIPPLPTKIIMANQVNQKITTKAHKLWHMSERGLLRRKG